MDNNESYIIKDLEKFIESVRTLVFNNFGKGEDETSLEVMISNLKPKEKEELDEILSQEESISIVKSLLYYRSKNLYTLDDKSLARIIESLNDRMVSNILNSLVNRGLVETAFDTESNDFVFWVKENENNKETPETD
jgi:hypothetical protein